MSTAEQLASSSLRQHPKLAPLFKAAESRHLSDQELEHYIAAAPEQAHRAQAAKEIASVEAWVVKKTLKEIFSTYPYEEHHNAAPDKCERDVTYVSAYATMTMLMDDPQWFGDKLLFWMKTILQAFEFPGRPEEKKSLFGRKTSREMTAILPTADTLKSHRSSIFATYTLLKDNYQAVLSPTSWALMEAPLQQAIDILSAE